jgi:hypothetical protein
MGIGNYNYNSNTIGRKGIFVPPNFDQLDFYWKGRFDGNDLINEVGTNIPYVSGSGLDAIYNFGVLSGNKWDKGSYVGNAFALPEIYDFPYPSEIYYDNTSATTRKYWKLKDFHYRFIQTQLDVTPQILNNIYFATLNYSATVLQSVTEIISYNIEQTGSALNRLKTHIGILPDYYGDNEVTNGDFANSTGGLGDSWNIVGAGIPSIVTGSGHPTNAQRLDQNDAAGVFLRTDDLILKQDCNYRLRVYTRSNYTITSGTGAFSISIPANTGNAAQYEKTDIISTVDIRLSFFSNDAADDEYLEVSDVVLQEFFQNYYKNEA